MEPRFEQFIQKRKYLLNVSPATLDWYKHSLEWLRTASPSQDELKDCVYCQLADTLHQLSLIGVRLRNCID